MRKFNIVFSLCLALLLILTATITGTLAFETLSTQQYADTPGNEISVSLIQHQRVHDSSGNVSLQKIEKINGIRRNKELIPLVGSAQYDGTNFDKYGMPTAEGYVDQIVRIKNTGTAPAYVRLVVAIPAALDDANDVGNNALHWNLGNRFMPDGNFSDSNTINESYRDNVRWTHADTAVVDDIQCNIYIFTYEKPLESGQTTDAAAFVGFYLDRNVNVVNGYIVLDGVNTGFANDEIKIHVKAQAVQSAGFNSAAAAFAAEHTISTNPWANERELSEKQIIY